jgi:hypothetical protein
MITVTQLIAMLSRFPGELPVVVRGYEAGADDISQPRLLNLYLAVNEEEYYGPTRDRRLRVPAVFIGDLRSDEKGWRQ